MILIKKYSITALWLFAVAFMSMVGQLIAQGTSLFNSLPITIMMTFVCLLSIVIKDITPKNWELPTFAWAMIIGMFMTMGDTPLARWILEEGKNLGFIVTTTPLLAFAGLSMVDQVADLKKLSWKIVIISVVVFTSIFFICASIAEVVLKLQGAI